MRLLIFIIILFFSSNVFSATYLLCKSDNYNLQVKLGNKKIYIRSNDTEEFINYSNDIVKWSDEIIITEKKLTYDKEIYMDKCSHTYHYMRENKIQNKEDLGILSEITIRRNQRDNEPSLFDKAILVICEDEYIEIEKDKKIQKILIDRIIGELKIDNPYNYLPNQNFQCEVIKKTLF